MLFTLATAKSAALILVLWILAPGLRAQTAAVWGPGRPISWSRVVRAIARDQKQLWTFPIRVTQRRRWAPALGLIGVASAAVAIDPASMPNFRRTRVFHGFNAAFSGRNTHLGIVIVPSSLYVAGLIRKDSYQRETALLAGVAVLDAEILTVVMKDVTRRLLPVNIPATGDFRNTWFKSQGDWLRGRGSFPSGHTIAAFSVATVISRRYSNHHWAPFVAYGLASLVGFSRVTLSSHFPSDVLVGAALGYSVSRYAALR